jgi:hypothetical protein
VRWRAPGRGGRGEVQGVEDVRLFGRHRGAGGAIRRRLVSMRDAVGAEAVQHVQLRSRRFEHRGGIDVQPDIGGARRPRGDGRRQLGQANRSGHRARGATAAGWCHGRRQRQPDAGADGGADHRMGAGLASRSGRRRGDRDRRRRRTAGRARKRRRWRRCRCGRGGTPAHREVARQRGNLRWWLPAPELLVPDVDVGALGERRDPVDELPARERPRAVAVQRHVPGDAVVSRRRWTRRGPPLDGRRGRWRQRRPGHCRRGRTGRRRNRGRAQRGARCGRPADGGPGGTLFPHGDDVRAGLAADLEDLPADFFVRD